MTRYVVGVNEGEMEKGVDIMKTFVASFMVLMGFTLGSIQQARAEWPVEVQNFFTPQQVTFAVENIYGYPVACEGRFFAATYSNPEGIWLNFAIGPVYPGTWGRAFMTPPFVAAGDYFISIPQTLAYCKFI